MPHMTEASETKSLCSLIGKIDRCFQCRGTSRQVPGQWFSGYMNHQRLVRHKMFQ